MFASVLGVESVGVHDDFFSIGGDSILALSVRSEAEARGIPFDIEEFFGRPTAADMAESISRAVPRSDGVTARFALLPMIDHAALHDAEDAFPATALQLGMVFHSMQRGESTTYKDAFRYRVAMPCGRTSSRVSIRPAGRATSCVTLVVRIQPALSAGAGCP